MGGGGGGRLTAFVVSTIPGGIRGDVLLLRGVLGVLLRLGWVVEHLFEELELCEGGEWEDEKEEEV